jgi:hypothetical protein
MWGSEDLLRLFYFLSRLGPRPMVVLAQFEQCRVAFLQRLIADLKSARGDGGLKMTEGE